MSRAEFQARELERLKAAEEGREFPVLVAGLGSQAEVDFCEEFARHGDPVKAVRNAKMYQLGFSEEELAEQVLGRPEIQVAIQALRRARARLGSGAINRDSIVADVEEVYEETKRGKRHDWALAAKRLQAQMLGLLIEKREVVHSRKIEEMTDAELLAIANRAKLRDGQAKAIEARYELVTPKPGEGGGVDESRQVEPVRAGIGEA